MLHPEDEKFAPEQANTMCVESTKVEQPCSSLVERLERERAQVSQDNGRRRRAIGILAAHPEFEDFLWLLRSGLVCLLLFAGASASHSQALPVAPTSCATKPCLSVTWNESVAAATVTKSTTPTSNGPVETSGPVTVTLAWCQGGTTGGCGSAPPSGCNAGTIGTAACGGPGGNPWLEETVSQTTPAGSGIIPGMQYGALIQVVANANFSDGGGTLSAWSAPFSITIGQAPAVVPIVVPVPAGLAVSQL